LRVRARTSKYRINIIPNRTTEEEEPSERVLPFLKVDLYGLAGVVLLIDCRGRHTDYISSRERSESRYTTFSEDPKWNILSCLILTKTLSSRYK